MSASAIPLNPKVLRDGPFLQRFWSFLKYQMNMNYDLFKYQINFHKPYQMLLFRFREQEQDIDKTWMIRSNKDFGGATDCSFKIQGKKSSLAAATAAYPSFAVFQGVVRPIKSENGVFGYAAIFNEMHKIGIFTPWMDVSRFKYFAMRYRGDGNMYKINIRSKASLGFGEKEVYQANFQTTDDGTWKTLKIPFEGFKFQSDASYTDGMCLDQSRVFQIGIVFNPSPRANPDISNEEFPFRLEIDHIRACNDYDSTRVTTRDLGFEDDSDVWKKSGPGTKSTLFTKYRTLEEGIRGNQKRKEDNRGFRIYGDTLKYSASAGAYRTRTFDPIKHNEVFTNSYSSPQSDSNRGRKSSKLYRKDPLQMTLSN